MEQVKYTFSICLNRKKQEAHDIIYQSLVHNTGTSSGLDKKFALSLSCIILR